EVDEPRAHIPSTLMALEDGEQVTPLPGAHADCPQRSGRRGVQRVGDAILYCRKPARQHRAGNVVKLMPVDPIALDPVKLTHVLHGSCTARQGRPGEDSAPAGQLRHNRTKRSATIAGPPPPPPRRNSRSLAPGAAV